jgi:tetratricopeptide (TPR) repeat protein
MSVNSLSPIELNALMEQAVAYFRSGQPQYAEPVLRDILNQRKSWSPALNLLSILCLQSQRMDEGLALITKSLKVDPRQPDVHHNRGLALHQLGHHDQALASFDRAIELRPDYAEAYCNRAITLAEQGRFDRAVVGYDRAITLKPGYAVAYYNRAIALEKLRRYPESLASYDKAIAIDPGMAKAYCNRGGILETLGQLDAAMASYDRAIAIDPGLPDAQNNKSLLELLTGDFEQGWRRYEWRWQSTLKSKQEFFAQPLWLNDVSIEGRTILIHAEQGFGDTIQFCRYIERVAALGARVIFRVAEPLLSLMRSLPVDCTIVPEGAVVPAFDFHCPLLSLPLAFKTTLKTIPAERPYLRVDEDKRASWGERLGARSKPRVGIAWSGSKAHRRDHFRSMTLSQIEPLLDLDLDWHCLQKEVNEHERAKLNQSRRVALHGEALHDFSDTAALIETMDLVISIDSSPVHLAGALQKPVWVLLPYVPDFRWLLHRSDSPWYPSATLFRQSQPGIWDDVIAEVVGRLPQQMGR